jgi:glyoxylase-like metal-dependent hydrolase (beta-lactamase superfamily II)
MKLYSIDTGFFKLDGGAMYGVVPKTIWNKLNPADENNLCTWAMRCLLIEDGKRLMLIDNGIGNKQDEKFLSHYYLHGSDTLDKSLAKHGFSRNDITDVFLTHLHFDHCGGSIVREGEKLVPAFKNAIYWSNELHWEWAVKPNLREKASFLKENILPIKESGQLQFIKHPWKDLKSGDRQGAPPAADAEIPFAEGITIKFVDGHTESMMLPHIQYRGRTIVYMADLFPSVSHLPIPYVMAYDVNPLITLSERESFLEKAVQDDQIFFFEHDAKHECCTLQQTEKGVRMRDVFGLHDLG